MKSGPFIYKGRNVDLLGCRYRLLVLHNCNENLVFILRVDLLNNFYWAVHRYDFNRVYIMILTFDSMSM